MNIKNEDLIMELTERGVFEMEELTREEASQYYEGDGQVLLEMGDGKPLRVVTEDVSDGEVLAFLANEQLKSLKYIEKVIRVYVIISIIAAAVAVGGAISALIALS